MYMLESSKKLQMAAHEDVIQTKYTSSYPKGLIGFIDDYRAAYNGLFRLGKTYPDADMRDRLLNNLWTPDLATSVDHCVDNRLDFAQTCNYFQDRGVRVEAYESAHNIARAHLTSNLPHAPPSPHDPTVDHLRLALLGLMGDPSSHSSDALTSPDETSRHLYAAS